MGPPHDVAACLPCVLNALNSHGFLCVTPPLGDNTLCLLSSISLTGDVRPLLKSELLLLLAVK